MSSYSVSWNYLKIKAVLFYLLVVVGLFCPFFLQNNRMGFEAGHHGYLSAHGLLLAKNLSSQPFLLMYNAREISSDGHVSYEVYNQFPVFPFAIFKLITNKFEDNFALQIYVGRQIMNLFLVLSVLLAFFAVREMVKDSFLACAVTSLSFSSYYILFYSDMTFPPHSLAGFMLALFVASKNISSPQRPLFNVVLPILSVSIGWEPFAVYACWFLLDLVGTFLKRTPGRIGGIPFYKSPSFFAFSTSIIWGIIVLSTQLINELFAVGNNVTHNDTLSSIMFRMGLSSNHSDALHTNLLKWTYFIKQQPYRCLRMLIPFSVDIAVLPRILKVTCLAFATIIFGFAVWCVAIKKVSMDLFYVGLYIFSGFCWSFPMKNFVVIHNFAGIYYIGIPLAVFSVILVQFKIEKVRIVAGLAIVLFVFSVAYTNIQKEKYSYAVNRITADFQNIHSAIPPGSKIYLDENILMRNMELSVVQFYLSDYYFSSQQNAGYVVSLNKQYNHYPVTQNSYVNVFMREMEKQTPGGKNN